jgi:hypothetical protein
LAFGQWLINLNRPLNWQLEPPFWQMTLLKASYFPILGLTDVFGIKFTVACLHTSRKHSTSNVINVSVNLYFSAIAVIVDLSCNFGCDSRTS